ncbi:MAG: hypothetical protein HY904_12450 [Deltaproteobacteria bacterium]|nr:hypothetical protein [Deltaproteobacteria bacterium]
MGTLARTAMVVLGLLWAGAAAAQSGPDPLIDAPVPPPAASPPPAAPPPPGGTPARSWDELGVGGPDGQEPGKPAAGTPDAASPPAAAAGGELTWSTALKAGGVTAAVLVGWTLLSPFLGVIPFAGTVLQIVGLAIPFIASAAGWTFAARQLDVRAPLRVVALAGALQFGVDLCCCLPFIVTPLAPAACLGRCLVDATVNGLATAFFLKKWGRLKAPGEPEISYDLVETPPPANAPPSAGAGAPSSPVPGGQGGSFLAPTPPPAAPPSPDADSGMTVK